MNPHIRRKDKIKEEKKKIQGSTATKHVVAPKEKISPSVTKTYRWSKEFALKLELLAKLEKSSMTDVIVRAVEEYIITSSTKKVDRR